MVDTNEDPQEQPNEHQIEKQNSNPYCTPDVQKQEETTEDNKYIKSPKEFKAQEPNEIRDSLSAIIN